MLFHVLNRGVGRMQILRTEKDYDAFRRVLEETLRVAPICICAYCWLPNHCVNSPETEAELEAIRRCLRRGSSYGGAAWTKQTANQLGLQSTLRRRGRPNKGHL